MLIFIYSLIVILIGLGNKLFQSYSGNYDLSAFVADLPLIIFTFFGLIAIWGHAKSKKYFSEKFWQVYFVAILISIFAIPFVEPSVQKMIAEFGTSKAIIAYAVTVVFMLPYYFGLYSYSFSKNRVWKQA